MAERGGKHTPGRGASTCQGYVVRGKSGQNEELIENSTVWNTEKKGCGSEKKLESVSHTVEGADGKAGSPSRSPGGLTCENLEASSLRLSALGCWSREGEARQRDISTCRTTSERVKEP